MLLQNDQVQLTNEQQLLILASRLQLTKEQEDEIQMLLDKGINVPYLIELGTRHKVLQLITPHLIRNDKYKRINTSYKYLLQYNYIGNRYKNESRFKEIIPILKSFYEKNIRAIPLKGSLLAPQVYKDLGLRTMTDLDFLISPDTKTDASKALKSIGYQMGSYDWTNNKIVPVSREDELMWHMNAGNLYAHVKLTDEEFLRVNRVDFSYDVDLKKNYDATYKLLEGAVDSVLFGIPTKILDPNDFLIHLAFHLYKEATNVQFVFLHVDLNLIKFCDIREYVLYLEEIGELDWGKLAKRAVELNAEEAIFYSLYFTDYIYGGNFSDLLNKELKINDLSFLDKYGEVDYGSVRMWKKTFVERLFSENNSDEIETNPSVQLLKRK
ncbi:nucleotidyltransferase family protein [Bacillus cereus group sp. N21]|uniref:nucleotidyltransferase domain-containing protein n=1 Tax=Bacillus cereus group sp. N21 TaxID=2794591 RepID=UPI0018F66A06|nr:nucleotidyltransferase family protein [Bacillus cereus group sp. N21]MBJ8030402.1 nucleotidyltransferase family protein [Bacillus cereus group sp. N21]